MFDYVVELNLGDKLLSNRGLNAVTFHFEEKLGRQQLEHNGRHREMEYEATITKKTSAVSTERRVRDGLDGWEQIGSKG